MKNNIYLGLVHYPVLNKTNEVVNTSITNLDIHDISRSCHTFGIKNFFIIQPIMSQHELFSKVLNFWNTDIALSYNPDRVEALSVIKFSRTIDETIKIINNQELTNPLVITTTAAKSERQITIPDLIKIKRDSGKPILLLFGTGNGLTAEIHAQADHVLQSIIGVSNYNHLSVRSAVAIVLDRLISEEYKEE